MLVSTITYSAVCLHSIEEIHYLKSFFPRQFTAQETFYAAAIELIKKVIAGIPFLLELGLCAVILETYRKIEGLALLTSWPAAGWAGVMLKPKVNNRV
jgi:hypothetical protein